MALLGGTGAAPGAAKNSKFCKKKLKYWAQGGGNLHKLYRHEFVLLGHGGTF